MQAEYLGATIGRVSPTVCPIPFWKTFHWHIKDELLGHYRPCLCHYVPTPPHPPTPYFLLTLITASFLMVSVFPHQPCCSQCMSLIGRQIHYWLFASKASVHNGGTFWSWPFSELLSKEAASRPSHLQKLSVLHGTSENDWKHCSTSARPLVALYSYFIKLEY